MKTSSFRTLLWSTTVLLTQSAAWCTVQAASDDLFDPAVVHQIRLTIHPADWQQLKTNYYLDTYYPCAFEWRGLSAVAGLRSAGLGTRSEVKPALRIDFNLYDEHQKFLGLKSVRLKNMIYDASMVKERIVMLFYRRMGLIAPRTAHVRLYINNQYAGLYLMVESIDRTFLQKNFGDDEGYLYKYQWSGPYRFEYLGPDASKYVPGPFEPHTHELDPNPGGLVTMIRAMNETSDAQFERELSTYLDLKLFLTQLAVEMYFAETDGMVAHHGLANFYLYQFSGKNAFQFIPWDRDRTFFDTNDSIWRGTRDNVLTRRALEVPALRQAYMEAFSQSAALAGGAGGWLEQEISRESAQVLEAVREDPVKRCPNPYWDLPRACSVQDFTDEVTRIIQYARERGDVVKRQLAEASFGVPLAAPRLLAIGPVSEERAAVLVPGSLVSVYGQGFALDTMEARGFPLPTSLARVSVLVNGAPAPLLFVSPRQVNLQVPWEISPGTALITVVSNGLSSQTLPAPVGRAAPTLLAVMYADGAPVSAARPARPGDRLVVFATGLGPVSAGVETGQASPNSPLITTSEAPSVKIGDLPAKVEFSGLAPGLAGVFQINTVVPEGMGGGPATLLTVAMAGETSSGMALPTLER